MFTLLSVNSWWLDIDWCSTIFKKRKSSSYFLLLTLAPHLVIHSGQFQKEVLTSRDMMVAVDFVSWRRVCWSFLLKNGLASPWPWPHGVSSKLRSSPLHRDDVTSVIYLERAGRISKSTLDSQSHWGSAGGGPLQAAGRKKAERAHDPLEKIRENKPITCFGSAFEISSNPALQCHALPGIDKAELVITKQARWFPSDLPNFQAHQEPSDICLPPVH